MVPPVLTCRRENECSLSAGNSPQNKLNVSPCAGFILECDSRIYIYIYSPTVPGDVLQHRL